MHPRNERLRIRSTILDVLITSHQPISIRTMSVHFGDWTFLAEVIPFFVNLLGVVASDSITVVDGPIFKGELDDGGHVAVVSKVRTDSLALYLSLLMGIYIYIYQPSRMRALLCTLTYPCKTVLIFLSSREWHNKVLLIRL